MSENTGSEETDIYKFVAATIAHELKVSEDELTATMDLRSVAGIESIKVLRIISRVEQKYDVEFDDDTVFKVNTIQDIIDAVQAAGEK